MFRRFVVSAAVFAALVQGAGITRAAADILIIHTKTEICSIETTDSGSEVITIEVPKC
jgi:hypothetical protein